MPFPVVPVAMAAFSIGQGIVEGQRGRSSTRSAMNRHNSIPTVDPGVRQQLNDFELRANYAEHGQNAMMGYRRNAITSAGVGADRAISRVSGTAPGATVQGILRNRAITADSLAEAGADSDRLGLQYRSMMTPLVTDIADRRLSMDYYLRDMDAMQGAQHTQNSNGLIQGGLGVLSQLEFGMGGQKAGGDSFAPPLGRGTPGLPAAPGIGGGNYEWDWSQPPANAFSLPQNGLT